MILFNDRNVLHPRPDTVAFRRRMSMVLDDDGQMIPGDECDPNFLTFVSQLRENRRKKVNQEIDPNGD